MADFKIVHISDVHFTSQHFSRELWASTVRSTREFNPDLVVVSGDLTDDGYPHEYKTVVDRLGDLSGFRMLVVPGNHDSRNYGYKIFEKIFKTRYPFFEGEFIRVVGIDSSEPDIDDGHVGRLAYRIVSEKLEGFNGVKIVVLHHHLIPIPGTGRERNIPVDAGDFLELLDRLKVSVVLCGHKHVPWIWKLNDMYIVNAGTASTLRLKAYQPPSFNKIEVSREGRLRIVRVNVDTGDETTILEKFLKVEV